MFTERFRARKSDASPLSAPAPDDSFSYVVGRAVSVWPICNQNQAAFVEEDFSKTRGLKSVIGTDFGFKFGLVNANHSVGPGKANVVLGSIRDEALISGSGVDIVAQIDKRACEAYDIEPQDFADEYGNFSIEIACDRDRSTFVAMTNPASQKLEDQTIFTAEEAAQKGVRRTSFAEPDPFLYEDKYVVVELCSPIRCRGVAVLPDPADRTANVYEVAASMEERAKTKEPYGDVEYADPGFRDGKKRYPVDTPERVRAAASYFGQQSNRDKYSSEQQKHIQDKIDAAKKKFGIGDEEDSGFALADMPTMNSMASDYDDVDALDVDAAQDPDMPDEAFADTHFDPEEVEDKRKYPLYASKEDFIKSKPHKGLVKAALQAHADGKIHNRKSALTRLQTAHQQMQHMNGAQHMTDEEKAALESKLAEVQAALESKDTVLSEKDTEIAGLKEQNTKIADELAALKGQIESKTQEELANKRLSELTAIEGFAVSDEEKAALVETLKTEDQVGFENRVLKAKIASMELAAKKKADKKDDEEDAGLLAAVALGGLDIFPSGNVKSGDKEIDLYAIM